MHGGRKEVAIINSEGKAEAKGICTIEGENGTPAPEIKAKYRIIR